MIGVTTRTTTASSRSAATPKRGAKAPTVLSQAAAASRSAGRVLFPQWLRTLAVVILWLGVTPVYVGLIAPYGVYSSAQTMCVGLVIASAISLHLWPPRTAPWRTLVWAALLSAMTGATLLPLGSGRFALMAATLVGFAVVALRVNQNGRRLMELFRTWRALR